MTRVRIGRLNWELYINALGEWQWRVKARNWRIIAASSEGFHRMSGALRNLKLLAPDAARRLEEQAQR